MFKSPKGIDDLIDDSKAGSGAPKPASPNPSTGPGAGRGASPGPEPAAPAGPQGGFPPIQKAMPTPAAGRSAAPASNYGKGFGANTGSPIDDALTDLENEGGPGRSRDSGRPKRPRDTGKDNEDEDDTTENEDDADQDNGDDADTEEGDSTELQNNSPEKPGELGPESPKEGDEGGGLSRDKPGEVGGKSAEGLSDALPKGTPAGEVAGTAGGGLNAVGGAGGGAGAGAGAGAEGAVAGGEAAVEAGAVAGEAVAAASVEAAPVVGIVLGIIALVLLLLLVILPAMGSLFGGGSDAVANPTDGTISGDVPELAQQILQDKNISAEGNPKSSLQAAAAGKCSPSPQTGGCVMLDKRLLTALLEVAQKRPLVITSLTTGDHTGCSNHYEGRAADLGSTDRSILDDFQKLGATELLGPGDEGHSDHLHVGWDGPHKNCE